DDLLFKTIDGNDISLDLIIAYRIDPKMAPYILQYVATSDKALRDKVVRTIARSKPRDIFGELATEEFYISDRRREKSDQVKQTMQKILGPYGIIVERVMTKDYRFVADYQRAIEDKKIADQMAEKNKSAQHAALEEYRKELESAKGEVNKLVADADGVFKKAKIEADAYYEQQKYLADAITAEGKAEARGIEQMNKALAGAGGETMVKLRIAEALQGKRIILLPLSGGGMNLKTTNINDLIDVMGVQALGGAPKKTIKE
ncbi:MAG: prohibitin family protein, partial [Geopsychrobacter sp.]|nr:prohibitin family protein [Geopsychrobacter sp.]